MPESFQASEYRLVQERVWSSAANADSLTISGAVPEGKIWTILAFAYIPSVAETQVISILKVSRSGALFSLLNPISLALNPARATFLEQGVYYDLLPGEQIRILRGTHTAGSSMDGLFQFIEWDMPLYDYLEPQAAARIKRAGTSLAQRVFRSGGGGGGGGARGIVGARMPPARPK